MSVDELFTVSTVTGALESTDGIERVLVSKSRSTDEYVFEAYPEEESVSTLCDRVGTLLESYGPRVSEKETTDGRPYCDIRISAGGLIDDR